jgi:hypothetical protein
VSDPRRFAAAAVTAATGYFWRAFRDMLWVMQGVNWALKWAWG